MSFTATELPSECLRRMHVGLAYGQDVSPVGRRSELGLALSVDRRNTSEHEMSERVSFSDSSFGLDRESFVWHSQRRELPPQSRATTARKTYCARRSLRSSTGPSAGSASGAHRLNLVGGDLMRLPRETARQP